MDITQVNMDVWIVELLHPQAWEINATESFCNSVAHSNKSKRKNYKQRFRLETENYFIFNVIPSVKVT